MAGELTSFWLARGRGVVTAAAAPSVVAVDAPVSSTVAGKSYYVFGFDRLYEGYVGNTVTMKRLSDNAQQSFGFITGTGIFDLAAVDSWRAGADVDMVDFIDQKGGSFRLPINAGETVPFVRSGTVKRFGTTYSDVDGQLTRSATQGGVACNLGGDVTLGCFKSAATTINMASGLEAHILYSHNRRKIGSATPDEFGGDNLQEYIFSYGLNSNNYMGFSAGTSNANSIRGNVNGDNQGATISTKHKKFGQSVKSMYMNTAEFGCYDFGLKWSSKAMTAGQTAAISSLNNGLIVIGNVFSGTSTTNLRSTFRGDMLFGGIILTQSLTDAERYLMRQKLAQVGQQHRIKSAAQILSYFDDVVIHKDVNPSTGRLNGKNGKAAINFNIATNAKGTPTWDFAYDIPGVGLRGIRNPLAANQANSFEAIDSYFAGTVSGTVVALHLMEDGGSSHNGTLVWDIVQSLGDAGENNYDTRSLGVGYGHSDPEIHGVPMINRNNGASFDTRRLADGRQFGTTFYDLANQGKGKYRRATSNGNFVYGETVTIDGTAYTFTKDAWANIDSSTPKLDAPTGVDVADNIGFTKQFGALRSMIVTFQAPVGYDRSNSYAARAPDMLKGVTINRIGLGTYPAGHVDGSLAKNANAGVVDSDDAAKLKSMAAINGSMMQGTRVIWAFSKQVLTEAQCEEVQVNMYKLVA